MFLHTGISVRTVKLHNISYHVLHYNLKVSQQHKRQAQGRYRIFDIIIQLGCTCMHSIIELYPSSITGQCRVCLIIEDYGAQPDCSLRYSGYSVGLFLHRCVRYLRNIQNHKLYLRQHLFI